jgi:hypothetical protein
MTNGYLLLIVQFVALNTVYKDFFNKKTHCAVVDVRDNERTTKIPQDITKSSF